LCAALDGAGLRTATYDIAPTCPRWAFKESFFSEEGVFSFEYRGQRKRSITSPASWR
jgi:hypothetical protein